MPEATPLGLIHVEKIGDEYVPVCRYCDFVGHPRRRPSDAQTALRDHQTSQHHRRALCCATVGAGRLTEEAT